MNRLAWQSLGAALLLTLLMATWALGIARYGGPDEPAHVVRAGSVASGEWIGRNDPQFPGGFRVVTVPATLATGDPACFRHDAGVTPACAPARPLDGIAHVATAAGAYPPTYYGAVGMLARLIGDRADAASYRWAAIALSAVSILSILLRLRWFGRSALLACAWLTPTTWFLLGVVNPNGLEILLVILAWVGVARAWNQPDLVRKGDVFWISVPLGLAIAVRPVAFGAVVAIHLVVFVGQRCRPLLRRAGWWAPQLIATAAVLAWHHVARFRLDDPRASMPAGFLDSFTHSVGGTAATLRELVGSLGWLEFSAPWLAQGLAWSMLVAITVALLWHGSGAAQRGIVTLIACLVAVPVLVETVLAGQVGLIWQGRYSASTAAGIGALGLAEFRGRLSARDARLLVGAAVVVESTTFLAVVHRYTVGLGRDGWFSSSAGWAPPVPVGLLIAIHLTLVCVAAVLMLFAVGRSPTAQRHSM